MAELRKNGVQDTLDATMVRCPELLFKKQYIGGISIVGGGDHTMDSAELSLRQRKLLHHVQSKSGYITGSELAKALNISSRTVRNDISNINRALSPYGVRIQAKKSIGYALHADDEQMLKDLKKKSESFLTRDERIRYIAFRLCLVDQSVNLYDLEEEMFVSRTTLEHDISGLQKKFVRCRPCIGFQRQTNWISFEQDERKIRTILNLLYTENWNYDAKGNTYYQYQYMDESVVNLIMNKIERIMSSHNILLEDINMVMLDIAIAIMYYRVKSNHILIDLVPCGIEDDLARQAVDALSDSLEADLDCTLPPQEREEVYGFVTSRRLLDASKLSFGSVQKYFSDKTISIANAYIKLINSTFNFDFSNDEDFYITLLQYLRYLEVPDRHLNQIADNIDIARSKLAIEIEIAFIFQDLAFEYLGRLLDGIELMYLAFCISGALAYVSRTSPKLKTVLMCHLNYPVLTYMKQQLLSQFNDYIEISSMLPVHAKNRYDFSDADLILTTANKTIDPASMSKTVVVTPFLQPLDISRISSFIFQEKTKEQYHSGFPSIDLLLSNSFWHERVRVDNRFALIDSLARDLLEGDLLSPIGLKQLLIRESTMSYAFEPGIVCMCSLTSSSQTRLSIATLEHRIKWNGYKIRIVILAAVRHDQSSLIFKLINGLFYNGYEPDDTKFLKCRDEVMKYLRNRLCQ